MTPDGFYAALLAEAEFSNYETKVIKGFDEFLSLAGNFIPDAFLLFSAHLGTAGVSRIVIEIRSKFRDADIFQIEGVREPTLSLLWSSIEKAPVFTKTLDATSVETIDRGMRELTEPKVDTFTQGKKPTNTQLAMLVALASGRSNQEVAHQRKTTVRAVETLMKRALVKIGADQELNSRSKIIVAQKYLSDHGIHF